MVVFTCNTCGESLQKPKVAKHVQFHCRSPIALTCVDCLKDFLNDQYIAHTKCVTEAERYGGKNFVPKPSANKGEKKQQEWINIVNNVLTSSKNLTNDERSFLQNIAKYDNIPRKKAKYLNFIKNALGYKVNYNIVESCWEKMESAYKEITVSNRKNNSSNNNENSSLDKSEKKNNKVLEKEEASNKVIEQEPSKKKKRKLVEIEEVNTNENSNEAVKSPKKSKSKKKELNNSKEISENGNFKENYLSNEVNVENNEANKELSDKNQKFDWKSEILQIFESKQEISLKKLKKKILQKYSSVDPDVSSEKVESKFNKKLKKMSQLVIRDDRVKLTS